MKPTIRILTGGFCIVAIASTALSCTSDDRYHIDSTKDIDTEITVFGEGLQLPVGKTEQITIDKALNAAKSEDLSSLLTKDKNGKYSISKDGNYNMDKVISDLHLEKLRDIDGTSVKQKFSCKLGDFSSDQFTIKGQSFDYDIPAFGTFSLDDIKLPSISAPDQKIETGMYAYLPQSMDMSSKIDKLDKSDKLVAISEIYDKMKIFATDRDKEYDIQEVLDVLEVSRLQLESYQQEVNSVFELGENASQIAGITNFSIKNGASLKVDLSIVNCPLTDGSLTPDINLNLSNMVNVKTADAEGNVNFSGLVLNKNNDWHKSVDLSITSLADGFPYYENPSLKLKGRMNFFGEVLISGAKSKLSKVEGLKDTNMILRAVVSCEGIVLDAMDILLSDDVNYSVPDVSIDTKVDYSLPKEVAAVSKLKFKESNKLDITVSSTGLSNLVASDLTHHISVVPQVEITFPQGLEVLDENGNPGSKYSISGEDLFNGPISRKVTLVSLAPQSKDGKLSFDGTVTATIKAKASGIFSTKFLPTEKSKDVTITTSINCSPALADYDAILDKEGISQKIDQTQEFSFQMDGMADFGTFNITPKGSPSASINIKFPATTETQIVGEKLVIGLPDFLIVDGSSVEGFDAGAKTITINDKIPEVITLPISYLHVKPVTDASGKTCVKGYLSIKGGVSVDNTSITRITMDELSGKKASASAVIPQLEAETIELEGDLNKEINYECKDVVILDEKAMGNIPKEVKYLSELDLDKVNATIRITVQGLPDNVGTFSLKNTRINLPKFIFGNNGTNVLELDADIPIENGKAAVQTAVLAMIKDVNLEGVTSLKGDVKFESTLYSHKPEVDVKSLKSEIDANVEIIVGDGSSTSDPGKIAIDKALVKVGYDVEQSESLSLGDIPSELKEEGVNLALDPSIRLSLKTNFGAPLTGDFVITPYIDGKALTDKSVTVKGISLPCSKNSSDTLTTVYAIGNNVSGDDGVIVKNVDLSPLIERIPDKIELAIKASIDSNTDCVIYPSATYCCGMDYNFNIPLAFGENLSFSISSNISVGSSVNDYLKLGEVILKGNAVNSLPVGVNCSCKLFDPDGNEIPLNKELSLRIEKSSDGSTVVSKDFALDLDIKDRSSVNLKTLLVKFDMDAANGVNVTDSQFVQLKDITVVVPKGATFNASEEK